MSVFVQRSLFERWETKPLPPKPVRRPKELSRPKESKADRVREAKARAGASIETVIGVLVERLDARLMGYADQCEQRYGLTGPAFLQLVQDVQWCLFPEAFCDPGEPLEDADGVPVSPGVVPRNGGQQTKLTADHWEKYARSLAG